MSIHGPTSIHKSNYIEVKKAMIDLDVIAADFREQALRKKLTKLIK